MHEVSLAQSIVEIVADQRERTPFTCVRSVTVAVGRLSFVDADALAFAWSAVTSGTVADGARLVIQRPPGAATCTSCAHEIELTSRAAACPRCGSDAWVAHGGEELRVVELDVEGGEPAHDAREASPCGCHEPAG
jgi:hydrogenase nickel incorporation protein HypA/HybF